MPGIERRPVQRKASNLPAVLVGLGPERDFLNFKWGAFQTVLRDLQSCAQ